MGHQYSAHSSVSNYPSSFNEEERSFLDGLLSGAGGQSDSSTNIDFIDLAKFFKDSFPRHFTSGELINEDLKILQEILAEIRINPEHPRKDKLEELIVKFNEKIKDKLELVETTYGQTQDDNILSGNVSDTISGQTQDDNILSGTPNESSDISDTASGQTQESSEDEDHFPHTSEIISEETLLTDSDRDALNTELSLLFSEIDNESATDMSNHLIDRGVEFFLNIGNDTNTRITLDNYTAEDAAAARL